MWEIEWPEEKTGSFNLMTFYIDAIDLEIDVFHSIPCYYITQVRRHKISDEHTFSLPCFANLRKGGASEKVHKGMKICIGHVPGVTSKLTPSEIYVSSEDQIYH